MYNISIIVCLKNNLLYSQYFYKTLRSLYPTVEICFTSFGSKDGTEKWLEDISKIDPNIKTYCSSDTSSLSHSYNTCVSLATKKYVVFLHNDIVVGPNFLQNIVKHLDDTKVVSYTVVEPPVFNSSSTGKIIQDFGDNIEKFDIDNFYEFCSKNQIKYSDKTIYGSSFFMALSKETFESIGGFDTLFDPMFAEDIDLIWRLENANKELITTQDSLCYHFVSKTSRFSDEFKETSAEIEYRSNRNFVRKWGSTLKGPKYSTSLVVDNCNYELLELIEPWCDHIYIHKNLANIYIDYLQEQQKYTKINLKNKLYTFSDNKNIQSNDSIIIYCDGNKINEANFSILAKLPSLIKDNNKLGTFTLDIFTIVVKNINTITNISKNIP